MKHFLEPYQSWRWDETEEQAEQSLAELDRACEDYKNHISLLADKLGPELLAISDAFYVDDAIVSRLGLDRLQDRIELTLRCGNIPDGYFDLELVYEEASMDPDHEHTLKEIATSTITDTRFANECYCHELDVLKDGRIEHRFLFQETDWFAVRCKRLRVQRVERKDRQIPPVSERLLEAEGGT